MSNPVDKPRGEPTESDPNVAPQGAEKKQQAVAQLESEIERWQAKIDAARLQMHLGAREVRDTLQPLIEKLERELSQAQKEWKQLNDASEGAWKDIQHGLRLSLKAMQRSFDKAEQHFEKSDEN